MDTLTDTVGTYVLRMRTNGLADMGILAGDYLVVSQREPQPGDMVLVDRAGSYSVERADSLDGLNVRGVLLSVIRKYDREVA